MPAVPAFEVLPYNLSILKDLLTRAPHADKLLVENKLHLVYFEEYFQNIGAETIVVENDYVDRDFLEDYAGYYVRCFREYPRRCTRVHFFAKKFSAEDFEKYLGGGTGNLTKETLRGNYRGFIVVKPLPQTVVGRTCLATYDDGGGRRCYPITRKYDANLFGTDLEVETLAFQEQDTVVAACATSTLWSVFQGTGKLFHHRIPSPVEITEAAVEHSPLETRSLPNHGLTHAQMAHAIRSVGLEPFYVRAENEHVLKSTLYAYLRGKVPVPMGITLCDTTVTPGQDKFNLGLHAVAVTGYGLGTAAHKPYKSGFLLEASRIDKLYVHDDQVGPFARMRFDGIDVNLGTKCEPQVLGSLSTSWRARDGKIGPVRAVPDLMLIPLYHKIRIPFGVAHDKVSSLDELLEPIRANVLANALPSRLWWDCYLTTATDVKRDLLGYQGISAEYRRAICTTCLPRFIWRATACCGTTRVIDVLLDATEIEQGDLVAGVVEYDATLGNILRWLGKNPPDMDVCVQLYWPILKWLAKADTPGACWPA